MYKVIIFAAILAFSSAAPGYLLTHEDTHLVHAVPLTSKSTLTKSSQVVNHGSTHVLHASLPVVHASVPVVHEVHTPVHVSVPTHYKTNDGATSSQYFHLSNTVYQAPKVTHEVHSVHPVHTVVPVVHSSPVLVHSRSGDSAVTHQSSSVHETVPLYSLHH